jgi:hypothetical protein
LRRGLFILSIACLGIGALGAQTLVRADGGDPGEVTIETIMARLRELGGAGWGKSGPGGACEPSATVNCHDAAAVQGIVKTLVGSLTGQEIEDPSLLRLIFRIQGAKTELRGQYLEFALYFDKTFAWFLPESGERPEKNTAIESILVPQALRLNVFSEGERGTITVRKPDRKWRQSVLRLRTSAEPFEFSLDEGVVSLLDWTFRLRAGLWDCVGVWAKGDLSDKTLKFDLTRTFIENLKLLLLLGAR